MNNKLFLRTDFRDYYDPWFDMDDVKAISLRHVLFRYARGGIDRIQMFEYLHSYGLTVPVFGTPRQVYEKLLYRLEEEEADILATEVVGYLDLVSHRGEGKVRTSLKEALSRSDILFCSVFHKHRHPTFNGGVSIRRLYVGDLEYVLEYRSTDDWRSNCGEVDITILEEKSRRIPGEPLFAIDFIPTEHELVAIDYNAAPQIGGTGIENILSGKEIVAALKRYIAIEHAPKKRGDGECQSTKE